jgi:hypothetical protein
MFDRRNATSQCAGIRKFSVETKQKIVAGRLLKLLTPEAFIDSFGSRKKTPIDQFKE